MTNHVATAAGAPIMTVHISPYVAVQGTATDLAKAGIRAPSAVPEAITVQPSARHPATNIGE